MMQYSAAVECCSVIKCLVKDRDRYLKLPAGNITLICGAKERMICSMHFLWRSIDLTAIIDSVAASMHAYGIRRKHGKIVALWSSTAKEEKSKL